MPSPVLTAMRRGAIVRIEELTRIPADVQDALITVLSEKMLPIPELGDEVQAVKGFNLIATANDRDKGVNELSAALRRRFNTVVLPLPEREEDEVRIVSTRVADLASALELPAVPAAVEEIRRVVTVFRELRSGVTKDGRTTIKSPSGTLSAAEAISVITSGLALSAHFGDGWLRPADVAAGTGRRDHQGSGGRPGRLDGVPRAGGARAGWLGRVLRSLPRGVVTAAVLEVPPAAAERDDDPVRVFGIRHHGPGSARSLLRALDEYQPDAVLIEGPADADPLIGWVTAEGMRPPLALLAYAADEPKVSAFWPFAVFSPEWQAMVWAVEHGVEVRFCDLPAAQVLAPQSGGRTLFDDAAHRGGGPDDPARDPLGTLAAAAGYDDPGALVGGPRRVPAGLLLTLPAAGRGHGRAASALQPTEPDRTSA